MAFGFGTSAHCIFKSLDHDNSGEISYMELIESFNTAPPKNTEVKQLCTSLMFAFQEEGSSTACAARLNTSGWVIKGEGEGERARGDHSRRALLQQLRHPSPSPSP